MKAHKLSHFLSILELTWLVLWIHKAVARRSAFLTLPNAQNGGESIGGVKNGRLKRQFSQLEGDMDLQNIPKLVSITKNKTPKKKVVVVKDEDEKLKKLNKFGGW